MTAMSGMPPDDSPTKRTSAGALAALIALSSCAVLISLYLGFTALVLTEPPHCFMQMTETAQAQCEQALAEGWSMVPAILHGALALVPLIAVLVAWLRRRVVAVRWIALAVVVASVPLGFLLPAG
jgi:hypothetical protein